MSAFAAAAQDDDGDTISALRAENEQLRQAAECLSAAGYAGLLMVLIGCAALAIHAWAAWWTR